MSAPTVTIHQKREHHFFEVLLENALRKELAFDDEEIYKIAVLLSGDLYRTLRRCQARIMDEMGIPKEEGDDAMKKKRETVRTIFNDLFKDIVARQEVGIMTLGAIVRKHLTK